MKSIRNHKEALEQALQLALTAPNSDKAKECLGIALHFSRELLSVDVEAITKKIALEFDLTEFELSSIRKGVE